MLIKFVIQNINIYFCRPKNKRIILGYLKNFIVPFSGLSIGSHVFAFDINEKFFDEFEYSEIKKGDTKALLNLDKQENMLVLIFNIEGHVIVECDRCLEEFEMGIKSQFRLIIKLGSEYKEESDEIITIPEKQNKISRHR